MKNLYFVFTIENEDGYVQYSNGMSKANVKKFKESCENLSKTGQKFYVFKRENL